MERFTKGWNFVRLVRLGLGLYILVASVTRQEWILACAGLFLTGTALFNVGCCQAYGCPPPMKSHAGPEQEIIYEEVVV